MENNPSWKSNQMRLQKGNAARAGPTIRAARLLVRWLFLFFFRVKVRGRKNMPDTPLIICVNHLGWADPFLILTFLPVKPRIYVLGYTLEALQDPGARAFRMRVLNSLEVMVALDVNKPLEALRTMKDVLKRGGSLLIFPEGTYMGAQEGRLQELQEGASHLSLSSGVPILPVGLTGTRELWFRKTLTLRIGKPVYPGEFEQGELRARMHAMNERLSKELWALLPGEHGGAGIKLLRNWLTGLFYEEETSEQTEARKHKVKVNED